MNSVKSTPLACATDVTSLFSLVYIYIYIYIYIFCVELFEVGDEIASGGLQSWIKECSSKLKLYVVVREQQFMNCCKRCVGTQNYVSAHFHIDPKCFSRPGQC